MKRQQKDKVFEGGKCRFCDGILFKQEVIAKKTIKWKRKAYHFKYRLRCPKCKKCFCLESSKYFEHYDLPEKLPTEIQPNNKFAIGKKQLKKERMETFLKTTLYEIDDLEIEKEQMNPSQWRLFIGTERVDIYPKGQKYCHLELKHWGKYDDVFELIESFKY